MENWFMSDKPTSPITDLRDVDIDLRRELTELERKLSERIAVAEKRSDYFAKVLIGVGERLARLEKLTPSANP